MLELDFVLNSLNGRLLSKSDNVEFPGVSTDSRRIRKGELFFALCGSRFDGHDFIQDAFERGAGGAVVEKPVAFPKLNKFVLIQVPSTLKALGDLALAWRKRFTDTKIAAITGSNGKTTTKEMASSILSLRFSVLKNSGNLNNLIGLPLTLLKLKSEHRVAVVELGMNDFGEIRRLSEITLPDVGAITCIGKAHLEKLGSVEGVARAKGELVESFTDRHTFVVNLDDPWIQKIASGVRCRKITFGIESKGVDISAKDIQPVGLSAIKFRIIIEGKEIPLRIRGIGCHNVMNALCATGIAVSLGCDTHEVQAGLERFVPAYMRLEVIDTPFGFKVINDAYNANPDSMRKGIEELVRLKGEGRAIAVLGDMLELGDKSESEHIGLGEFLVDKGVDFVIAYGNYGTSLLKGTGGRIGGVLATTHEEAAEVLIEYARPGDLVLIKGSRGVRMENVIQKLFERYP